MYRLGQNKFKFMYLIIKNGEQCMEPYPFIQQGMCSTIELSVLSYINLTIVLFPIQQTRYGLCRKVVICTYPLIFF